MVSDAFPHHYCTSRVPLELSPIQITKQADIMLKITFQTYTFYTHSAGEFTALPFLSLLESTRGLKQLMPDNEQLAIVSSKYVKSLANGQT